MEILFGHQDTDLTNCLELDKNAAESNQANSQPHITSLRRAHPQTR